MLMPELCCRERGIHRGEALEVSIQHSLADICIFAAESVVYIEVKHWKSASKKMSTLGWSFAPIEMFIDTSSENTAAR